MPSFTQETLFSWKDLFIWELFLPASGDPFHLRGLHCGLCPTLVQSQGGLGSTWSTLWDPGRGHNQAGSTPGLTDKYGRSLVFILPIVYVHRKCTEPFPENTEPLWSSEASWAPCYGPEAVFRMKGKPFPMKIHRTYSCVRTGWHMVSSLG